MDQPIFRYIQRVPEFYNIEDPIKMCIRNGMIANDPYLEKVKELGLEDKLTGKPGSGSTGPDVVAAVLEATEKSRQPVRFQP